MTAGAPIRIGNASGFYGDRFSAVREMLTDGPLDVLTGDYLAELTMLILGRDRMKDPSLGYAKTFLRQLEENLGLALDRGVMVVSNAGGLNPAGLAERLREVVGKLGLTASVAYVDGDDLLARAGELNLGKPLTANAYLGAWGIAECLRAGADIVVTGRVTDASLVVGPAIARYGWTAADHDALAGAVVAGHVIECGTQATGGNYSGFGELDISRPGFPIAEIHPDGSSVITKHDGTGGAVTIGTVTAQLLYEIGAPRYANPDATARFDTIRLSEVDKDRIRISGVRGEAPPPTVKVCLNTLGGFRNQVEFVLTGLDIDAKAELVKAQMTAALAAQPPAELTWTLTRTAAADGETEEQASTLLRCVVKDANPDVVGRAFSGAAIELALASYPGFFVTAPPGKASPYAVYTAAFVDANMVPHNAHLPDGTVVALPAARETLALADLATPALPDPLPTGPTRRVPLGSIVDARSGDKGGSANVGVWARSDEAWRWLAHTLTVDEFRRLLPEAADLPVSRYVLPNLRALNFVVEGLLGQGVASQARFDPQAKGLGEWLRARHVDIPESLL
ncbi:acyclic terpene utilization AtuA family protein [Fodinicola feengrottensis]